MTQVTQPLTAGPRQARNRLLSYYRDLFSIDLRSLALFRISIALVMLTDLVRRTYDFSSMYVVGGALPLQAVHDYYANTWKWSFHLASASWNYQACLFVLAGVSGLALLAGYRTRIATCTSWILTVSLNARTPMLVNGGDVLLCMGLFWAMFLPLDKRFSVDSRRRLPPNNDQDFLSIACLGILLQIGMMYLFTGLWKFNSTWLNGEALEIVLGDTAITRPLGSWLTQYPQLLKMMTRVTLALELLGPVLLFSPGSRRYLRPIALVLFAGLHVGIELTLNVLMFSYTSLAMLTLFVPACWWNCLPGLQSQQPVPRSKDGERPRETGFPWPPWCKRLGWILGCCVIGYATLYNILTLKYRQSWPPQLAPFTQVATIFHFGQRWSMFDQPDKYLFRFAFYGRLKNGKTVELLRNQVTGPNPSCPDSSTVSSTQRWMLLFRELTGDANFPFQHAVAHYLASQWNRQHPESEHVLDGEFMVYLLDVSGNLADAKRKLLTYCDMRANGSIRFGQRHGDWVLRHDNGKQSAAGRYLAGVETGHWTYWDQYGDRELEGRFEGGQKQGPWTSWDADGTANRGIFLNDKLIERLP